MNADFSEPGPDRTTDELDLVSAMEVVWKRRRLMLAVLASAILTSLLASLLAPRRYETSITVFVRDLPQARAAGVSPQTLAAFALSDRVLGSMDPGAEPATLKSSLSVKLDSTSRVLTVTFSSPHAEETLRRADRWIQSFISETRELIGLVPSDPGPVEVFAGPSSPRLPVSPRIALNVAVAAVFGIFAGLAAVFLAESAERFRERRSPAHPS